MSATTATPAPALDGDGASPAPTPQRVEWAGLVRVDLLPPEIVAARRVATLVRQVVAAGALTVLAAAGAVVWSQTQVASAQADLDGVQATTASLQAQQARYADVPRTLTAIQQVKAARTAAMGSEVLWPTYLSVLATVTPDGVWFDSFTATLDAGASPAHDGATTGASPGATSGAAPGAPSATTIGTLHVEGSGTKYPDVSSWMDAFQAVRGFGLPSLAAASSKDSTGKTSVTFTGDVPITSDALSRRFDQQDG